MATGHLTLVFVALALLAYRLVVAVRARREGPSDETPTYPEPKLQLEADTDKAHDVFGELASTLAADQAAEGRYLRSRREAARTASAPTLGSVPIPLKIVGVAGTLLLLVAVPYAVPSLSWLRVLTDPGDDGSNVVEAAPEAAGGPMPESAVGEASLPGATFDQQARARELEAGADERRGPIAQGRPEARVPDAVTEDEPPRSIANPDALARFFDQLMAVERKDPGAQAHILYYGDSIVASDFVSGKLRRLMQTRFGDAGHGYAIIANAWPGWFHIDVARQAAPAWKVSTCVGPYAEDGLYGLGCASFTSRHEGVWTEFGTTTLETPWGKHVSKFEIEYLQQPGGGAFDILVDGQPRGRLETEGADKQVAWHVVDVPDGPHTMKLVSVDDRPARVYGIRMLRDTVGVTLSAMGVTGARARFLDKQDDAHWGRVLGRTQADLVCLAFGSNEITDGNMYPMEKYRATLEAVMEQVEAALPEASFMLVGPPDMASKKASQGYSRPMTYFIAKEQKALAKKRGWAFWDQFRAMGGGGSMHSWIKQGLGNTDMFHPTGKG
ncbi:MAG: GDSL-type esterase/lipase family protein, partial [Myxococcota bacterium]